ADSARAGAGDDSTAVAVAVAVAAGSPSVAAAGAGVAGASCVVSGSAGADDCVRRVRVVFAIGVGLQFKLVMVCQVGFASLRFALQLLAPGVASRAVLFDLHYDFVVRRQHG